MMKNSFYCTKASNPLIENVHPVRENRLYGILATMNFPRVTTRMSFFNTHVRLQQVKAILTGGSTSTPKRGRPAASPKPAKRTHSPEARARIAAAQKKRWAAQKKAAK